MIPSTWQKLLFVLLLFLLALAFVSCKTPKSTVTTVIERDTVTQTNFISTVEPCEIDTAIILKDHGRLEIKGTGDGLQFLFFPEPVQVKTVEVLTNKSFKQREKTLRSEFRQTEKTLRDSFRMVARLYEDSIRFTTRLLADSTKELRKVRQAEAKVEVAKSKGGWFTRLKSSLFWLVVGLVAGFILSFFIKLKK